MNENHPTLDDEYEYKQLIHKIDPLIDNCTRDFLNISFHTFKCNCVFDIKLTNIRNNEINNSSIFDESMKLYKLNKK